MKNKINIAELLKDCPNGMELDCINYDGVVTFEEISNCSDYPIKITVKYNNECVTHTLTKYGQTCISPYNKCIIFPKGKTTWEGFRRPFKDGDIVATNANEQLFILQRVNWRTHSNCYQGDCYTGYDFKYNEFFAAGEWAFERHATEEEKAKLFDAIKANGYKWNAETKTLEKLVEPKFKVGDRIRYKENGDIFNIDSIDMSNNLYCCGLDYILITYQDKYELVPNKFDITTLKPFDKVLVRDGAGLWIPSLFGKDIIVGYRYLTTNGSYKECIPYEGNEHLLGTTNDCDEFYKTWEK